MRKIIVLFFLLCIIPNASATIEKWSFGGCDADSYKVTNFNDPKYTDGVLFFGEVNITTYRNGMGYGGIWYYGEWQAYMSYPDPIGVESTGTKFAFGESYTQQISTSGTFGYQPCIYINVVYMYEEDFYILSGDICGVSQLKLYYDDSGDWYLLEERNVTESSAYSFNIMNNTEYRICFDGSYYDFTCTGNEVVDYDTCLYVYGYTCGIVTIKLYKDDGGWVLDDTESQNGYYENYEMQITNGESYLISFIESATVCHNQTFDCTGDHVLIDYDRCEYIYPPAGPPIIIYLWTGYDYNIVVFKDGHGNFIENSQVAIYDKTNNTYIQKWTATTDGYALLGTLFDTDHDAMLMLRTFDGTFTLDTTYPANGSAAVGEENITTTNWTIPIKYNLDIRPKDQNNIPLHNVFVSMYEYTPYNPLAFFGYDTYWGYTPITNCSGFAMCDIYAEKGGYEDYSETALNWTSKSALIKDYRHTVTLTKE